MPHPITIQPTDDGSHTLFSPSTRETYHSTRGAVGESLHVFIQTGLLACTNQKLRVLEFGFGTGLNAYLTALFSENFEHINYTSIEKFPLENSLHEQLNFARIYGNRPDLFQQIYSCEWETENSISDTFSLKKIKADFTETDLKDDYYNLIFFDAFSPEKQPELWTETVFRKIYQATAAGGILTTYCAKGAVRRALQAAGFAVERLPGALGKREMLRGRKR